MTKGADPNLRLKRSYLTWLRAAKGLSELSIDRAAAALDRYMGFLNGAPLTRFHSEKAMAFKRALAQQKTARGQPLSDSTINGISREVRAFTLWLADQPGCRSKIRHSDAAWFSPDRKSESARRGGVWKPHPTSEQMAHVIHAMPAESVIQRRDRALMAFLFLTGCRETTAITLRLGHVDLHHACIHFDGRLVDTKFGKRFTTGFFRIGSKIQAIFTNWIVESREVLLHGPQDEVFPKTEVSRGPHGLEASGLAREC
ncbi:MAG: integrase [Pseudomonadota bacterium]